MHVRSLPAFLNSLYSSLMSFSLVELWKIDAVLKLCKSQVYTYACNTAINSHCVALGEKDKYPREEHQLDGVRIWGWKFPRILLILTHTHTHTQSQLKALKITKYVFTKSKVFQETLLFALGLLDCSREDHAVTGRTREAIWFHCTLNVSNRKSLLLWTWCYCP